MPLLLMSFVHKLGKIEKVWFLGGVRHILSVPERTECIRFRLDADTASWGHCADVVDAVHSEENFDSEERHSFVSLQAWRTWRPSPGPPAESSSRRRRCNPGPAGGREGSPHSRSTHAADTNKQSWANTHRHQRVERCLPGDVAVQPRVASAVTYNSQKLMSKQLKLGQGLKSTKETRTKQLNQIKRLLQGHAADWVVTQKDTQSPKYLPVKQGIRLWMTLSGNSLFRTFYVLSSTVILLLLQTK